jgi:hypothetical protein
MFKYLLPIILLTSVSQADTFSFKQQDKQLHMAVAYAGTLTLNKIYKELGVKQSIFYSAITMTTLGIVKESLDSEFSTSDLLANHIGITAGVLFTYAF